MKYYIIKAKNHDLDEKLIEALKKSDKNAEFVEEIKDADRCILQDGWTHSRAAMRDFYKTQNLKVKCEASKAYK